jgi:type I restriction enzyme, S subunit
MTKKPKDKKMAPTHSKGSETSPLSHHNQEDRSQSVEEGNTLKVGWEMKKLGEIAEIINGKNQSNVISEKGKYPIYGSAGSLMGYATDYLCDAGTTIIGRKGNISSPIFIQEKFWNVDTAFGLYPKNGYSPKFFNYLCQTIDFKSRNRGTTIPSLVKSDLMSIDVPFICSLSEQKRIVEILDKCFAVIEKAKSNADQNLKNAKELFESYLQSVFENRDNDWEEKTLGEVANVIGGYSFKSSDFKKEGKYQVLRMGNVRPGVIRENESPVYIDKVDEITLKRALLLPNDVIITQTGTKKKRDYGFTVIIEKENYLLNQRISSIRFPKHFMPKFFLYYSWTNIFKDQFFANETGTVGQGNVGIGAITNAAIPLPPLHTQQAIVKKLDVLRAKTQRLEEIYKKKIHDLEELKKSILQKAFNGEL